MMTSPSHLPQPHPFLMAQESPIKHHRKHHKRSHHKSSPIMRVSSSSKPSSSSHIMLSKSHKTPKGGSVLSFAGSTSKPKQQLTPITKKMLGVIHNTNNTKRDSIFKTPTRKSNHLHIFNSSSPSSLIDPNHFIDSEFEKTSGINHPNYLSSHIINPQISEFFSSPISNSHHHYNNTNFQFHQEEIEEENNYHQLKRQDFENDHKFDFSTIMQSSPVFHGYYQTTPTNSISSTNCQLNIRPMINFEPKIIQNQSDDDSDFEFNNNHKRQKLNHNNKPLLPPITISNLEFSSDDETDFEEYNIKSSDFKEISIGTDSNGKAILTINENTNFISTLPPYQRKINPSLSSSPIFNNNNNNHHHNQLIHSEETIEESEMNDEQMLKLINNSVVTITENNKYKFDETFESSEDDDECDARKALMKAIGKF